MANSAAYSDVPAGFDTSPVQSSASFSDAPAGFTAAPAADTGPTYAKTYFSDGTEAVVPAGLTAPQIKSWLNEHHLPTDDESISAYVEHRPVKLTVPGYLDRSARLGLRSVVNALTGIPQLADQVMTSVANKIASYETFEGHNTSPIISGSEQLQQYLDDLGFPRPTGAAEHVNDFLAQGAVGGAMPSLPLPNAAANVPENFVRNASQKAVAQDAAMNAGYVAPPATTNPTTINRVLESTLAGKQGAATAATVQNADLTQEFAKKALGLHPDTPINPDVLKAIYSEQEQASEQVASSGMMRADKWYSRALDDIQATSQKSGKFADVLKDTNLENIIDGLQKAPGDQFTADAAVAALRQLRGLKSDAYAAGNSTLGDAYRKASDAIENLIQRNLEKKAQAALAANGESNNLAAYQSAADTLTKFKNARKMIAMASEVERAMNPSTGEVSATKLAASPNAEAFTGPLATIRNAANALPSVTGPVRGSGNVSQLEGYAAPLMAAAEKNPAYAGIPFLRDIMRSALMTKQAQNLLARPDLSNQATQLMNPQLGQGLITGGADLLNQGVQQ